MSFICQQGKDWQKSIFYKDKIITSNNSDNSGIFGPTFDNSIQINIKFTLIVYEYIIVYEFIFY